MNRELSSQRVNLIRRLENEKINGVSNINVSATGIGVGMINYLLIPFLYE